MSKNKTSFLEKHLHVLLILCTIFVGFMFVVTHDRSLVPYIATAVIILVLSGALTIINGIAAEKKLRATMQEKRKNELESQNKQRAGRRAIIDKEFIDRKEEGKIISDVNFSERQNLKASEALNQTR